MDPTKLPRLEECRECRKHKAFRTENLAQLSSKCIRGVEKHGWELSREVNEITNLVNKRNFDFDHLHKFEFCLNRQCQGSVAMVIWLHAYVDVIITCATSSCQILHTNYVISLHKQRNPYERNCSTHSADHEG